MSGDVMMFPDTVEEFMEQNKVVDREQVYSNGIEFVPIFRMQQWFDHVKHSPDDVRGVGEWKQKEIFNIEDTTIEQMQSACCSVCGKYHTTPFSYYFTEYNYCPNCGARMKGAEAEHTMEEFMYGQEMGDPVCGSL